MSYSAKNVNDTGFIKNFKSGTDTKMADDDPAASEAFLQNSYNARQLNNGQAVTVPDRRSSLRSILSAGSKRKGVIIGIMAFIMIAGIVAICASLVMLSMLGVQRLHISSLESQLEALRAEKDLCKNDTTSLSLELTTCEKGMQGTQHQLEINAAQCDLEKGNLSAQLAAEVRKGEHEKELAQEKLNTCEGSKEELSQRLESQTRSAEAEKRALSDKVDQCEQQKRDMSQRKDEEIQQKADQCEQQKRDMSKRKGEEIQQKVNQCEQQKRELSQRKDEEIQRRVAAAEAAKSSPVSGGGSSWWSSNGAERIGSSPKAVLLLFTIFLPLLFKVLQVV